MNVLDVLLLVAALGAIVWFIWFVRRNPSDRQDETSARAFFDRHGHWPDEPPPAG